MSIEDKKKKKHLNRNNKTSLWRPRYDDSSAKQQKLNSENTIIIFLRLLLGGDFWVGYLHHHSRIKH